MEGELFKSTINDTYGKLDPRTKMLIMLIINITIFGGSEWYLVVTLAAIPLVLLFISNNIKSALYCSIAYAAAVLSNELLVPITHGILNIFVVMISGMIYRIMPGIIMGYYLVSTTTVSEFVSSMERMHVSQKIIIPLSVMFRFFPTIGEEAKAISDAMRMRGVSFTSSSLLRNPIAMIEYRIVPLLMSTVKIGDELSAASLTRGLGNPVKRTNICKLGFGIQDMVLLIIGIAAFIGFVR